MNWYMEWLQTWQEEARALVCIWMVGTWPSQYFGRTVLPLPIFERTRSHHPESDVMLHNPDVSSQRLQDDQFRHAFDWLKGRGFYFKYSLNMKAHMISHSNIVFIARHEGGERLSVCADNGYSFSCWSYQSISPYLKLGWKFSISDDCFTPFSEECFLHCLHCTAHLCNCVHCL